MMMMMMYNSSWSSKVDDYDANRKRICNFLLVRHSNFGPILHRFWDTATYWLKIAYFLVYPSLIRRPCSLRSLWSFTVKLSTRKIESWSYSVVKVAWSYTSTFFDWSTRVTDRRTVGRTDGQTIAYAPSALCCRALKTTDIPKKNITHRKFLAPLYWIALQLRNPITQRLRRLSSTCRLARITRDIPTTRPTESSTAVSLYDTSTEGSASCSAARLSTGHAVAQVSADEAAEVARGATSAVLAGVWHLGLRSGYWITWR